tara:strand:- start:987 stop:1121 length:135 start_codon:yes stop_codon:yes gene_type:complete
MSNAKERGVRELFLGLKLLHSIFQPRTGLEEKDVFTSETLRAPT